MKAFSVLATVVAGFAVTVDTPAEDGISRGALPEPVTDSDYYENGAPAKARVELGRLLFFDKILSGNKNISCATCHHPQFATTDGIALPLGEGPKGLGPDRRTGHFTAEGIRGRVPRNTPALFNLGAKEFRRMFHDGRVEVDLHGYYQSGFISPARWKLPEGLDNVLAAQAMFPSTAADEMAGHKGENTVAEARSLNKVAGPGGVWTQLADRLQAIPEYVAKFRTAYPTKVQTSEDIDMVLAANAIATFEARAFRADNSPFDQYLRSGEGLSAEARLGMELFYGKAGCHRCHRGKFQTDHEFHAIAMPQIGPGKADGRDSEYWRDTGIKAFLEDFGRGRVTVRVEDNYRFRTPSLRNVALTGPWSHAGAYDSLEAVVQHHLDPTQSLTSYRLPRDLLPPLGHIIETRADGAQFVALTLEGQRLEGFLRRDDYVMQTPALRGRIAAANELEPVALNDEEVTQISTFLESLTDPKSVDLTQLVPESVPSGLSVVD